MNDDLSGELMAISQYITYAARSTGAERPQLVEFFNREIPDETGHAQFLANKIAALGGEPTTQARPVPDAETNRDMLKSVLDAEKQAIDDYTERVKEAEALGDKGLQVALEDIVRDETTHYEETKQILKNWELQPA
ncbi:MAG: ferritin-like domain-containing protein [Anaerolineales bacterium]